MKVNFYLSDNPDKRGDYPIRVSVSINGCRITSTAGVNASPKGWNVDTMLASDKYINAKGINGATINARLLAIRARFSKFASSLNGQKPTCEQMRAILADTLERKQRTAAASNPIATPATLMEYFDKFIIEESKANQWADGTHQAWAAFRKHLEAQGFKGFDDLNDKGIIQFVDYLRTTANGGVGMVEVTVRKQYGYLRWFLNYCIAEGWCSDSQIGKVRPKFKTIAQPVIFLDNDELKRLHNISIPANGVEVTLHDINGREYKKSIHDRQMLEHARDLFLFCASTGLRFSDMEKLKRSQIKGDIIELVTKKTNDRLTIELNKWSREILAKYENTTFAHDAALPHLCNQVMNRALKDLCEICEFNTPITKIYYRGNERVEEEQPKWTYISTHAGRRSFVCRMLSLGATAETIMRWTGHSDYDAMKPYIAIAEKTKAEQMKLFDKDL